MCGERGFRDTAIEEQWMLIGKFRDLWQCQSIIQTSVGIYLKFTLRNSNFLGPSGDLVVFISRRLSASGHTV